MFNSVLATVGVKFAQDEIGSAFPSHTIRVAYLKAILLGGTLAFLLGYLAYMKWRFRTAFWVWLIGLGTFVWRLAVGNPDANDPSEVVAAAVLVFLSVQCVFYSLGALSCRWWRESGERNAEIASSTNF